MAYDEPSYRRHAADDSEGNESSAHRTGTFSAADYRGRRRDTAGFAVGAAEDPTLPRTAAARAVEPGDVSDRRSDRLGIHLGWEAVLLLGTIALAFLLYRVNGAAVRPPALKTLLVSAAAIGMLTLAAGVSLRAGVPNLAVGPIAVAAGLQFADNGDRGLVAAGAQAIAIAVVGSVLIALMVILFHVPGWAATLAAALGVVTFNQLHTGPATVQGAYEPVKQAYILYGAFAVLAVLGGLLGTMRSVRNSLGRMRPVADPARRRGMAAALPVIAALVLSSVLAVVAGTIMAAASPGPIQPLTGLEWTGIAIGLALIGGTSAFGRRGGVFGTLLAATAMAVFLDYSARKDLDIALFAIAGAVVAGGLVVTRLIEAYGSPSGGDDAWTGSGSTANNWSPDLPETWSPATAGQPNTGRWDEDRWGNGR